MSQQRIEVSLAGQKITLATSADHEPLLRAACVLVDEQIQLMNQLSDEIQQLLQSRYNFLHHFTVD